MTSTFRKLLILSITLAVLAIQAQTFPSAADAASQAATATPAASFTKGTVVETMNAGGYTYLHLEKNGQKQWAAIPATQIKVGDEVEISAGMEMNNFPSKSLGRTFESIIFSQGIMKL
jgi:hypothetical protein